VCKNECVFFLPVVEELPVVVDALAVVLEVEVDVDALAEVLVVAVVVAAIIIRMSGIGNIGP
jgi:hypothetical protein